MTISVMSAQNNLSANEYRSHETTIRSRIMVIEKTDERLLRQEVKGYSSTHEVIDTYTYTFDNQRFYVATLSSKQPSAAIYFLVN